MKKEGAKNIFTVLVILSCLVVVAVFAVKVLIIDDNKDQSPQEGGAVVESNSPGTEGQEKDPQGFADVMKSWAKGEYAKRPPDPKEAPFTTSDMDYFKDALFIGDSRTVGIMEYGKVEGAVFFADVGMSTYSVRDKQVDVPEIGTVTLDRLLSSHKFKKIYIMLGINEVGSNHDILISEYSKLIDYLQEKNGDAIIFIEANLHVGENRSNSGKTVNNKNINALNKRMAGLIDNKKIFYIDANEKFDDENGNLGAEYSGDDTHLYAKYYPEWRDWLLTKTIVKGE